MPIFDFLPMDHGGSVDPSDKINKHTLNLNIYKPYNIPGEKHL